MQLPYSWKVTQEEKHAEAKQLFFLVFRIGPPFVFVIIVSILLKFRFRNPDAFAHVSWPTLILFIVLGVFAVTAVTAALLYISKSYGARRSHSYTVTEEGVHIATGAEHGYFAWEEFASFAFAGDMGELETDTTEKSVPTGANKELLTVREVLLFKLKSKGFWRTLRQTFVYVYLDIDAPAELKEFVKTKVKQKDTQDGSLSLSVYKYK